MQTLSTGHPVHSGHEDPLEQSFGECFAVLLESLKAVKRGDLGVRLPGSWAGLPGELAANFNEVVSANEQRVRQFEQARKVQSAHDVSFTNVEIDTRDQMGADLLELATEAIIVRRLDGAIQFWNAGAEALYGWKREEAIGKDLHGLLRTVFPVSRIHVEGFLAEQRSWQGNLRQLTRSGSEIVVACRKTMNREGDAVLEVGRDITSQLKVEEVLRESEKLAAMGRVAGIIAHEINNPLTAITNIFYLLRNHPSLNDEARSYAEAAERELMRVSYISRQTLSFYRDSKQPIVVRVTELIDDVLDLQLRAFQPKIKLRKKYSEASGVTGFPLELRQVFMNLVVNAIQAMPSGGTLQIRVREAIDRVTQTRGPAISIVDTGVGIKREEMKHLCEPFFSTKAEKGTGLGLWISKGILQKYNGRLTYRTFRFRNQNTTCFRIFIPGNGTALRSPAAALHGVEIEPRLTSMSREGSVQPRLNH